MSTRKHSLPDAARLGTFLRNQRGSISILTAVSMVPFIVAAGSALDMNRANRTLSHMQKAADSAALAAASTIHPVEVDGGGALTGDAARVHVAKMMVEANLIDQIKAEAEDPEVTVDGQKVTVAIEAEMATSFMSFVGIDTMDLSVTAEAEAEVNAAGCVVALGADGKGIQVGGTVDLDVDGCWLYSNKEDDKSIDVIGGAVVDVPGSCSVGTTSVSNNSTVQDKRLSGCYPIVDPLASWPHPTIGTCDHTKFKASVNGAGKSITLTPGVYCQGLQLSGYSEVNLDPGVYYITDGALSITSKANVTGNGVGFYLANDVTSVTINGAADVSLTASEEGVMAGLLFAMQPGADSLIAAKINGGSELGLTGTIYLASAELDISGTSGTLSSAMQIVADSITFSGTSTLSFSAYGDPLTDDFVSIVRLIK